MRRAAGRLREDGCLLGKQACRTGPAGCSAGQVSANPSPDDDDTKKAGRGRGLKPPLVYFCDLPPEPQACRRRWRAGPTEITPTPCLPAGGPPELKANPPG